MNLYLVFIQSILFLYLLPVTYIGLQDSCLIENLSTNNNIELIEDSFQNELPFEVNKVYPPISITKAKLSKAQSISDFNRHYKSSWVNTFITVEISTIYNGKSRIAKSKNDALTLEQKDHLNMADVGTGITVNIKYIPENTLKHNDVKTINFTFTVDPEKDAIFPNGQEALKQYLKKSAIYKIPDGSFVNYDLAAVKFTINEDGTITNARILESSKDETIDKLLLESICNMPNWIPATYANGQTIKQEFALTVGNMENCIVHTLNIYPK